MCFFSSVLDEISAEPAVGVMGQEKRSFVEALTPAVQSPKCVEVAHDLSKPLIDLILTRIKVVPSAQFEQALQKLQHILAERSFVQDMWGKLLLCVPEEKGNISKEVGHRLVWRICTAMLNKIQEIVFKTMIKHHQTAVSTFTMSEEDQLAFKDHVGFVLRSMYRLGAKSSNSVWHVRCQVLRLRFVCGDVDHENFDNKNLWQSGSVVLSDVCLNLFLGLERLIQSNKDKTCSADYIFNSLKNIENHLILNDMRQLSRGFLSENSALTFLQDIVKSYCATSCELEARRIVSQRKNAATVSLRTNLKRNPTQKRTSVASTVQAQVKTAQPLADKVGPSSTSSRRKSQRGKIAVAVQAQKQKPPADKAEPSTSRGRKGQPGNEAVPVQAQRPLGDKARPSTSHGRKGQTGNVTATVKGQGKTTPSEEGARSLRSQKRKPQNDAQEEIAQPGPSTSTQKKSRR